MNRIYKIFQKKTEKVIPFFTAGYPSKRYTVDMVLEAERAGAALVEIGIPFSDPLADGPIIQEASQLAIDNNVDIPWILQTIFDIRRKSEIPLILMGYINPILKYGLEKFIVDCEIAGVDGLIIPDLPPEEAGRLLEIANNRKICIILLVAPNTKSERIGKISKLSGTLIYCVSILGITGNSEVDFGELKKYLQRVKENSCCPFIVGFGIKNREDVVCINEIADGCVVGSAIIDNLKASIDPVKSVGDYINKLTKDIK